MDWPNWLGDLPTWLTTLAIAIAAFQYIGERRRRLAEEDRERKAQATELTAWAVTDVESEPRVYGVIVSNTSGSTFHDIVIDVTMHGERVEHPIEMNVLPPGEYFVMLNPKGSPFAWDFAKHTSEYDGNLRPYTKSDRYRVLGYAFSDNRRQRWTVDESAVLNSL